MHQQTFGETLIKIGLKSSAVRLSGESDQTCPVTLISETLQR